MKRSTGVASGVGLAAALFAAGALGPLRSDSASTTGARIPDVAGAATAAIPGRGVNSAIRSLQDRLQQKPRDAEALARLGQAYVAKVRLSSDPGFYLPAQKALRQSLSVQPRRNFDGALGMAVLSASLHDFRSALSWGRVARKLNRFDSDVLGVMTDSLVELGRYRAAERTLQKMVDLRPNLASYSRISYLRQLHGDTRGAIAAMREALSISGGNARDAAWASHHLADLYFGQGRMTLARRSHARAAYLAPGFMDARAGLAEVAAARGHFTKALRLLSPALRRPSAGNAVLAGDLATRAGRAAEARRHYAVARSLERKERAAGVNTELEVAAFAADHGEERLALRNARIAYRARPSVDAADVFAWALHVNGQDRRALRFAREALRLAPNSLFLFHSGMINKSLGRPDIARRQLAQALRSGPNFSFIQAPIARRALRELTGA